ncbi:undecaprenyl-phosphate glucose phosphotransferase [Deminuibacter soli]|uniref:Undecaprenyl-phosphate glucose phosphotransferase n=1 Tax=Deminuibacter soli TaxID=2291815 RepID=A0A3E1NI07_9BACT|nr:undecaprenyl-phosphate glucose phosphotransferase [Deminuibacter soli]RFM27408.1 undecaprenyl-phosphate glucose phosphotransferase [Deminuibacter soli]
MGSRFAYLLRITLLVSDFIIVNGSWIASYAFFHQLKDPSIAYYTPLNFIVYNVSWLMAAFFLRLYQYDTLNRLESILRQTAKTTLVHISFLAMFLLISSEDVMFKKLLLVCSGILGLAFVISRFFVTYIVEFIIKKAKLQMKTAIIGYNQTGVRLAEYFEGNSNIYSFEGFFDNGSHLSNSAINREGDIVGPIEQCIEFAVKNDIREIYSTLLPGQHTEVTKLVEVADKYCVRVKFVGDFNEKQETSLSYVEYLDSMPVRSLRAEPLNMLNNRAKKKIFDVVMSFLVIVLVLSWLVPIIGLLIKLESRGPVFFRQLRSGKNNKPFWCYKFRSMTVNERSDEVQATKNDIRVTRIGAFLRKTSLDEFPQFFNVLKGDMSIVGPRPHMLKHTEEYSALINQYMVRQFLKPGITGWAQVNGYRGETKQTRLMKKRVECDIWYMENWSLMLDIRIIFMTVINVFRGEDTAY